MAVQRNNGDAQVNGTEAISLFEDFFEEKYKQQIYENVIKGDHFLKIEFNELSLFNPDLAENLLSEPEEFIQAAQLAVESLDLEECKKVKVRFVNLPQFSFVLIRDIRSKHIGKFIRTEGVITQKSDVRPQAISSRFECPSCGNIITVLQNELALKEPTKCGCGRKGKFRIIGQEMIDAQRIVLEELSESLEGGEQPKRMNVFLRDDLVSPFSEKRTTPGSKVMISGIVKEVPVTLRSGAKSVNFDILFCSPFLNTVFNLFFLNAS